MHLPISNKKLYQCWSAAEFCFSYSMNYVILLMKSSPHYTRTKPLKQNLAKQKSGNDL